MASTRPKNMVVSQKIEGNHFFLKLTKNIISQNLISYELHIYVLSKETFRLYLSF